jgi:hypothetical protein
VGKLTPFGETQLKQRACKEEGMAADSGEFLLRLGFFETNN